MNVIPFLHWPVEMPVAWSDGQVVPPSVVCEIAIDWLWHCVPGEPVCASHPSWSSMKAISGLTGCAGSGRSCQVSPRSVLRKSRVPATSA